MKYFLASLLFVEVSRCEFLHGVALQEDRNDRGLGFDPDSQAQIQENIIGQRLVTPSKWTNNSATLADGSMSKTNWLIIVCMLISVLAWILEPDQIVDILAYSGQNLLKGKIWTLFTALFIHSDPTHLIGNMIFLYIFGNTLENELGETWVIVPFFIGGTSSFLISTIFYDPTTYLIGASAAIFTLTAIIMLVKPLKFSFYFLMPQGLVAIIYFTYNLLAVHYGFQGNISYIGHVIGFTIGIPFGIFASKDWFKNLLITAGLFLIYLLIIWILLNIQTILT